MSTYRLDALMAPKSIAVVGASPRERSLGRIALRNLREGGFAGPIHLVNPRHPEIDGVKAAATIPGTSGAGAVITTTSGAWAMASKFAIAFTPSISGWRGLTR